MKEREAQGRPLPAARMQDIVARLTDASAAKFTRPPAFDGRKNLYTTQGDIAGNVRASHSKTVSWLADLTYS